MARVADGRAGAPKGLEDEQRSRIGRGVSAPWAAIALVVALIILIAGMSSLFAWQSYRNALNSAELRAEGAAEVVGAQVGWIVETSRQALRRVDETLELAGMNTPPDEIRDLRAAVESLPAGVSVSVYGPNGAPFFTTDSGPQWVNVADRGYFRALSDGAPWQISALLRSDAAVGAVFVIGKRLERNGRFAGAAVLVVPARMLSEYWQNLELGPDSVVTLIRNDGELVARYPVPRGPVDLSGHDLFTEHLPSAPSGRFQTISPISGTKLIVGYHALPDAPLVALAGISRDAALAGLRTRLKRIGLLSVPLVAALFGIAAWVGVLLRRDAQQRDSLARALETNDMLFREIHHRVKNNLQTVVSLIKLQPLPEDVKQQAVSRIHAMSALHEHLYSSDRFGSVDFRDYIGKLVDGLRGAAPPGVEVTCRADALQVDADTALSLGLILNEAVSNAFKHAFPDGPAGGRVDIDLTAAQERVSLVVRDNGVGFDETTVRCNLGRRLIRGLVAGIDGDYRYEIGDGATFVLEFKPKRPNGDHDQPQGAVEPAT